MLGGNAMKKRISIRLLSAFLAFVMVFLMIPFTAVTVSAETESYLPATTGHSLLSSYKFNQSIAFPLKNQTS